MNRMILNLKSVIEIGVRAAAPSRAPEVRKNIAHGVSRGFRGERTTSPGRGGRTWPTIERLVLSPLTGLDLFGSITHGLRMGYFLSPLRGCVRKRARTSRSTPVNSPSASSVSNAPLECGSEPSFCCLPRSWLRTNLRPLRANSTIPGPNN